LTFPGIVNTPQKNPDFRGFYFFLEVFSKNLFSHTYSVSLDDSDLLREALKGKVNF